MSCDIKFNSPLNLKKMGLLALAFGLSCFAMGAVLLISEPTPLPNIVTRFLGRNPEFWETAELFARVFGSLCIVSGAMLIDLGARFLFSKKYKAAYVNVTSSSLSLPNLMTGAQHIIPCAALMNIEEINNSICITYRTDTGESSSHLSSFAVKDSNGFITSVNELLSNQAANQASSDLQSQHLYSVIFEGDSSPVDDVERQLTLLSKLVKRPLKQIKNEYAQGKVVVKRDVSKEQAVKLKSGLKKYKIDVTCLKAPNVVKLKDNSAQPKSMPFIAPTFSVMAAWVIPGGFAFWLLLNRYLLSQVNDRVKLKPSLFLIALLCEVLTYEDYESEVAFGVVGLISIVSAIYIAFGLKRTLENEFSIKLSAVKTVLFNVLYINYKTNQLVVEADK